MRSPSWQAPASSERLARPRHWFLHLHQGVWVDVVADQPAFSDEPLLRDWADRGRPLIARRRQAGDRAGRLAAAIALPPAVVKRRVAFDLHPDAVARVEPPPTLAVVRASAPPSWHATLDALALLGREVASEPRVFGSFAWQALTGLPYLTATSDLDLLWPVTAVTDLSALFGRLHHLEACAPGRLDGELVHEPTGAAVPWRELAGDARELLVKTAETVTLQPRETYLASLR